MDLKVSLRYLLLGGFLVILLLSVVVLAADLSFVLLGPNEASQWTELDFNRTPPLSLYPHYSREELQCFEQRKVYFRGNCWDLQVRGPCPEGNWIILDPDSTGVKPQCVARRCQSDSTYWQATDECILLNDKSKCTKKETALKSDALGYGTCKCIKGAAQAMSSNGACYFLYSRGFCDPGYVVAMDFNAKEFPAICAPDKCKSPTNDKILLPYKGSCYAEGSHEPCSNDDILTVDVHTGLPTCGPAFGPLHVIEPEPLCSLVDHNEKCVNKVEVAQKLNNFILDINNDINKHSKMFSVSRKG